MSAADVVCGWFAAEPGDEERKPGDIAGFDELWQAESGGAAFATMGAGSFRRMSGPVEPYLVRCVRRTLDDAGVAPGEVDRIVFATTDPSLAHAGRDFVGRVLEEAGLVRCVPAGISCQQCCGSITALSYGWSQFADPSVRHVLVVAFDRTVDDSERVRSFALFGDAVSSCLLSRGDAPGGLLLVGSSVGTDHDGLVGRDSMTSRQKVARETLGAVFTAAGTTMNDVTKVFPTNLYAPLTSFNSAVAGIHRTKLHYGDTFQALGHCGNCDWMLNLVDYRDTVGLRAGETYLALATAPGFFATGLLVGT